MVNTYSTISLWAKEITRPQRKTWRFTRLIKYRSVLPMSIVYNGTDDEARLTRVLA
jgi:hypothetical protein